MMARRSFAKNIIFIELEGILREKCFAWIYFNVEIILILFDIYIYIRIRIEGKKIFMTSFLLVKREKESLKIMVNISFQSIKSCTIKKW